MTASTADFAVFGSSLTALLLAGALASLHRQQVVLVTQPYSPLQLRRSLDLSVAPLTRPESWAMLALAVPETRKLIAQLGGKRGLIRTDPMFFADTPAGKQALAHIRHMAQSFGHAIARAPAGIKDREAIQVRDAVWLDPAAIAPHLDKWLVRNGVNIVRRDNAPVSFTADGSVTLTAASHSITAARAILADDAAMLSAGIALPPGIAVTNAVSILTEPAAPLSAGVMLQADTGLVLTQDATNSITALGQATVGSNLAQLSGLLANHQHVRMAGQASYKQLVSRDGAATIGQHEGEGAFLIAGLGPTGVFMVPALSRLLVGMPSALETQYFNARGLAVRRAIAEYAPVLAA